MPTPLLLWFRQDLRLADNPALAAALERGGPIIPLYIHSPEEEGDWPPGAASRWWLHESLTKLGADLAARGSRLVVVRAEPRAGGGATLAALTSLLASTGAGAVFWNRRYEPAVTARDRVIKSDLRARGLEVRSFNAALLREPWDVANQAGAPFKVFTPFWRSIVATLEPAQPLAAPERIPAPTQWPASNVQGGLDAAGGALVTRSIAALGLMPRIRWYEGFAQSWSPGEAGAARALRGFLQDALPDYAQARDLPAAHGTSRLSPHLHFGEISPRQVWHAVASTTTSGDLRQSKFLAEVGWREFAHHLLHHFPTTPLEPLRGEFSRFRWAESPQQLRAWQRGATGIPLVDAGMRELWHTGWMHNRVRMIAASFLVKNLRLPWQDGARWFWDTLVDADLASNTLGWQWVAGCGADAAPYFRVFNPVTQGLRFDPQGTYLRRWLPELARLPDDAVHAPWEADAATLAAAGVTLGGNYPRPLVDLKASREDALAAFQALRTER
jgi:deoxyribodipyrimidine photo-lyase